MWLTFCIWQFAEGLFVYFLLKVCSSSDYNKVMIFFTLLHFFNIEHKVVYEAG